MIEAITNWLRDQFIAVWDAFFKFMQDLFLFWLEHQLTLVLWMIDNIPSPDFLTQHTLGSLLGSAGPTVAWAITIFKVGEAAALISGAMVFYVLRRILTIGIW